MSQLSLTIETAPREEDLRTIAGGMIENDRPGAGAEQPAHLAVMLRQEGALIGGISGRMELGRLFVEYIWVHEAWRGKGHGAELLGAIETAALKAGCTDVLLETLNSDALHFYVHAGYSIIAEIVNYVPGFTRYVLLKTLPGFVVR